MIQLLLSTWYCTLWFNAEDISWPAAQVPLWPEGPCSMNSCIIYDRDWINAPLHHLRTGGMRWRSCVHSTSTSTSLLRYVRHLLSWKTLRNAKYVHRLMRRAIKFWAAGVEANTVFSLKLISYVWRRYRFSFKINYWQFINWLCLIKS